MGEGEEMKISTITSKLKSKKNLKKKREKISFKKLKIKSLSNRKYQNKRGGMESAEAPSVAAAPALAAAAGVETSKETSKEISDATNALNKVNYKCDVSTVQEFYPQYKSYIEKIDKLFLGETEPKYASPEYRQKHSSLLHSLIEIIKSVLSLSPEKSLMSVTKYDGYYDVQIEGQPYNAHHEFNTYLIDWQQDITQIRDAFAKIHSDKKEGIGIDIPKQSSIDYLKFVLLTNFLLFYNSKILDKLLSSLEKIYTLLEEEEKARLLELEREAAKPPPTIEDIKNSIIENIKVYLGRDFKPNKSIEEAKKKLTNTPKLENIKNAIRYLTEISDSESKSYAWRVISLVRAYLNIQIQVYEDYKVVEN